MQSFQFRIIRWLHGTGFPPQLRGRHIPEVEFDVEEGNPLTRSKLLLRGMTDSDLLPFDTNLSVCQIFGLKWLMSEPRLVLAADHTKYFCPTTTHFRAHMHSISGRHYRPLGSEHIERAVSAG